MIRRRYTAHQPQARARGNQQGDRIMFRALLILLGVASFAGAGEAPMKYRVYVGTYTGGKSKGIYRAELDLKTGKLTGMELAAETGNPSFLAIHPSLKYLYAVGEGGGKEGGVSA